MTSLQETTDPLIGPLYQLNTPILSVYLAPDGQKTCLRVPAGAVVSVLVTILTDGLFIKVKWESKTVLMFPQDLAEKTLAVPAETNWRTLSASA